MKITDFNRGTSRRQFLSIASLATAGMWLTPRLVFAGEGEPSSYHSEGNGHGEDQVTKLRGNVSVLEGSGGNIGVLTGKDGKVLVDAGITASRPRLTEALPSLSNDPVKHLVSTHWHSDHTGGNEWIAKATANLDAKWSGYVITGNAFTALVYAGV